MARLGFGDDNKFKSMKKRLREMRTPIIEKCIGCDNIDNEDENDNSSHDFCDIYINPEQSWARGDCPLASHIQKEEIPKVKVRVGQQKQTKN